MPGYQLSLLTIRTAAAIVGAASIAIVVHLALRERSAPVRCPDGLVANAGRCCGSGQVFAQGHCQGRASSCGPRQRYVELDTMAGCVFQSERVAFAGGRLPLGAADWQGSAQRAGIVVAPFALDDAEVTVARYSGCVRSGVCAKIADQPEPGLPVVGVAPEQAEQFCNFEGGRLPSSAEWRFAAGGAEGRRFPWGYTGLVCRRSAFGLVNGPCSTEGRGPDLAGARPAGATPEGIVDLSGNVAEWTRDPDGRYRARGGSFRSRVAAELVTAALESPARSAPSIGFRCAYDAVK